MSTVLLIDLYGNLLSKKQREAFDLYYNEDLSLGEISEHLDVTRQGVLDNNRAAEKNLIKYEECLGILNKKKRDTDVVLTVLDLIDSDLPCNEVYDKIKTLLSAFI